MTDAGGREGGRAGAAASGSAGEGSRIAGMVGLFDDTDTLMEAARSARDAGWRKWDCHTPYPVHGLEKAMGLRESYVPIITLSAGFFGAAFGKAMQWYMSAYDYPLIVGGKPLFSLPAFVPVTFELFVLFGAVTTFLSLIFICRLGRWHSPLHDTGVMKEVTSRRFAVVLNADDRNFTEDGARRLLEENGCRDVRLLFTEMSEKEKAAAREQ